ncbi:probable ubiquitin carboxyl-terminal hydrolase MINDY-4 [Limulus polyphemus]|uniref:Ubiquitin carboxyl-terminal hydrolase MINDY n=1 Tax=Limulus polyphemus TaxID=6850 RepID=A0ABM1SG65_LIMPO|nr:probable ubiquitin carboxyl-terminal hydrolase MINDY-4 [Limulus polyphemus]XP_022242619.1 probable ubiquitin carboxyl-terminal hydrolase MINDY-4 [Limulus polyphemus]XP_022242620.1 probable ubiquitin carboxyl-terminal hydrolase MINDY-4 [Limulus polyphemus]XP_022242621.1 probable ubiquitin carboxyl-terminal hydrolase MINDY-4 [Limulus polyphemus]XP_022242622.1 probable ubiquitin carboxyl-terminal hydrolase MINDY-4 [Limulus polyphemus]XP_022242623.1 probable ubiquitin carboxyl-terminal hydrolas
MPVEGGETNKDNRPPVHLGHNYVESVATSLVREFLARKSLSSTLEVMDQELPRDSESISNRAVLIHELHLEKLVFKNKSCSSSFRTLIELITKELLEKAFKHKTSSKIMADKLSPSHLVNGFNSRTVSVDTGEINDVPFAKPKTSKKEKEVDSKKPNGNHATRVDDCGKHNCLDDNKTRNMWRNHNGTISRLDQTARERYHSSVVDVSVENVLNDDDPIDIYDCGHSRVEEWLSISSGNNVDHNQIDVVETVVKPSTLPRTSGQKVLSSSKKLDCGPVVSSTDHMLSKRLSGNDIGIPRPHLLPSFKLDSQEEIEIKPIVSSSSTFVKFEQPSEDLILHKSNKERLRKHRIPSTSTEHDKVIQELRQRVGDLEVQDLSDTEMEEVFVAPVSTVVKKSPHTRTFRSITLSEAMNLKKIILGSPFRNFNLEWQHQNFTFCNYQDVMYGLVQKKGGPCGVVAAVQAYVILHLVFGDKPSCLKDGRLRPSRRERNRALALAIASILWKAGEKKRAVVAVLSGRTVLDTCGKLKTDGIIEKLLLKSFDYYEDLVNYLCGRTEDLQSDNSSSCITFLYSAILSRGIDRVLKDMDDPHSTLIGRHGYCTQEMVNLFLIGKAVSNVFDGMVELGTADKDKTILHGIPETSDIGFLSLFEHYQSCEVGSHYKNPLNPIWIVLSESHFSVLFATYKGALSVDLEGFLFDLFYYDGLARQDEEICLTIDPKGNVVHEPDDVDLVPPLELCIQTRWKGAAVDWNNTEPIL